MVACQVIAAILKPVLPAWGEKVERMLKLEAPLDFVNAATPPPADVVLGEYETLAEPLDEKLLDAIIEASKESLGAGEEAEADELPAYDYEVPDLEPEVMIDAFATIDLRVATVLACEAVEGARKLLRLELDLGPLGRRQVFSGIASSYDPDELVGKRVAVVANLKPRKMRFGLSEEMVLAAGNGEITVVELDPRARNGERIT